jgi:hypothetical protein
MRFDNQLSRMHCRTFSTGLSLGHFAGNGRRVMLAGMVSPAEVVRCSLGADGRVPRLARRGWCHSSGQPAPCPATTALWVCRPWSAARIAATWAGRFFQKPGWHRRSGHDGTGRAMSLQ